MQTLLLLFALACDSEPAPAAAPAPAAPEPAAPAASAPAAHPDAPRVPTSSTTRMAASHVLIAYAQAMQAAPSVTRTRDEARALAEKVREEAIAPGADFAALAKKQSDDPTGRRGGSLGAFDTGKMVQEFEDAVRAIGAGEITPVVETPFGFHVIRRDLVLEVHCAQLMVGFATAERPIPGVTRSKEDARARIEAAQKEIDSGTDWATVVSRYGDGNLTHDGGDLGWFGRRQLMPALDDAAFNLDVGARSDIVESPAGFHLLKRLE